MWADFLGSISVLQVVGARLNLGTWTTGELSATRTATSFSLETSHMTLMRMSLKISSWVCFILNHKNGKSPHCAQIVFELLQRSFVLCSIWKCFGAADQHQGSWWETAQLWICCLWWLWTCAENSRGQGRCQCSLCVFRTPEQTFSSSNDLLEWPWAISQCHHYVQMSVLWAHLSNPKYH